MGDKQWPKCGNLSRVFLFFFSIRDESFTSKYWTYWNRLSRLAFANSQTDTFLRLCLFTVPLRGLPLGFARDDGQSMSDDTLIIPHGATSVPLSGLGFSCHDARKELPLFSRADVSSGCI